mmetsp:Transcript_61628/g.182097  ORF Transcript_61628/g.182097 Transcript_61628/m.182097 type:complete len:216 (-) Transcript_61628:29-676(-)
MLSHPSSHASSPSYYFAHKRSTSKTSSGLGFESFGYNRPPSFSENRALSRETDEEINTIPDGATKDEFSSRPVMVVIREVKDEAKFAEVVEGDADVGTRLLMRKVPVKREPKVYFANERTLLAWLHAALWLFGGSTTIIKFADSNPHSLFYGILMLPIAIAITIYAIYRHNIRAIRITIKHPGPYEDILGPTVLGVLLMITILVQFIVHFKYIIR